MGDFNGDGKLDLALYFPGDTFIFLGFLGNSDGSFYPWIQFSTPYLFGFVSVRDINGDGQPNLVAPDYGVNNVLGPQGCGSWRWFDKYRRAIHNHTCRTETEDLRVKVLRSGGCCRDELSCIEEHLHILVGSDAVT